jgi:hypothetical protein
MYAEGSILSSFWEGWNGSLDPDIVYAPVKTALAARKAGLAR